MTLHATKTTWQWLVFICFSFQLTQIYINKLFSFKLFRFDEEGGEGATAKDKDAAAASSGDEKKPKSKMLQDMATLSLQCVSSDNEK